MDLRCERFEFCPEVTAKACRMGLKILEVPISYRPRTVAQGKKIRWRDGWEAMKTLWRYRRWTPGGSTCALPLTPLTPALSPEGRGRPRAAPQQWDETSSQVDMACAADCRASVAGVVAAALVAALLVAALLAQTAWARWTTSATYDEPFYLACAGHGRRRLARAAARAARDRAVGCRAGLGAQRDRSGRRGAPSRLGISTRSGADCLGTAHGVRRHWRAARPRGLCLAAGAPRPLGGSARRRAGVLFADDPGARLAGNDGCLFRALRARGPGGVGSVWPGADAPAVSCGSDRDRRGTCGEVFGAVSFSGGGRRDGCGRLSPRYDRREPSAFFASGGHTRCRRVSPAGAGSPSHVLAVAWPRTGRGGREPGCAELPGFRRRLGATFVRFREAWRREVVRQSFDARVGAEPRAPGVAGARGGNRRSVSAQPRRALRVSDGRVVDDRLVALFSLCGVLQEHTRRAGACDRAGGVRGGTGEAHEGRLGVGGKPLTPALSPGGRGW